MLEIKCPWCGNRAETEFSYGGDATCRRPDDAASDIKEWHSYVYERKNPAGPHDEYWQHTGGCRRWIRVRRDTRNHQISETSWPGRNS
jgi:methylglutamate dehydrogenase subunit B